MKSERPVQSNINDRWIPFFALSAFVLIVLGCKLWLIDTYANATPFWDQWDAEADRLYPPWLEGSLTWSDLVAPHNEHRIFTTRLLGLLLLELNGRIWDPVLEMVVNACLHVFTLSVFIYFISKSLSEIHKPAIFIFSCILFSIPFSWENTLSGFQSQFYFYLLFSFLFLWLMANYIPLVPGWWLGLVCGILSTLSLASGTLTVMAGLGLFVVRWFVKRERNISQSLAMLILLLLAGLSLAFTPVIEGHALLKAQTIFDFGKAMIKAMSWPVGGIGLVVIQAPLFIFMFGLLRNGKGKSAPQWFIFALGLWLIGQFVALSYGRVGGVTASRYLDLIAIGLVLNFSCLCILLRNLNLQSGFLNRYGMVLFVVFVIGGGLAKSVSITNALQAKALQGKQQEINVRAYLVTRDMGHLTGKPFLHVPYPNAERLKSLLDNPTIEAILPGNILARNSKHSPSAVKLIATFLSNNHMYFMILGGVAFGMLLLAGSVGRKNGNELEGNAPR